MFHFNFTSRNKNHVAIVSKHYNTVKTAVFQRTAINRKQIIVPPQLGNILNLIPVKLDYALSG